MVVVGTVSKSMEALSLRTTVHEALRSSHSWKAQSEAPGIQLRQLGVIIVPFNRTRPLREDSSS
jgi:hypothetical protein